MHILFNGCSLTWGDELKNRLEERYSTLVSNYYQAEHVNLSDCGRSNDAITRTTMQWFADGNTTDLAIIQWSIISRFEGYDDLNKRYIHVTVDKKSKWDAYYKQYYYDQLGIDCLYKNYYLLEQYFIKNNIKYFFMFHDCWNQFMDIDSVWKHFIIKKDFHFLRGNLSQQTILKNPLIDNCHFKGTNGGHPNNLGHQAIANYVIKEIDNAL